MKRPSVTGRYNVDQVIVFTSNLRKAGYFYSLYSNRTGDWVKYAKHNPRHLPVPLEVYEGTYLRK